MDTMIAIGKSAPDFALKDLANREHQLADYRGKIILLNFWSAECPWSERVDCDLLPRLATWGDRLVLLPVASNANETVEMLQRVATERGLPLVLHDPKGLVADLYQAVTTPHFFVIDEAGLLRYRGAYDDMTFRQRLPTRLYLIEAVESLLAGKNMDVEDTTPYGCAVVRIA